MTIGKKMYLSFALLLFLFLIVGCFSYFTIDTINDKTTVEKESLEMSSFFEQKITDHMEWVMAMYDRIYLGADFKKQLDPMKCDFGKWYYSFKTNDPELKKIYIALEAPHKDLHGSAELILAQLEAGNKAGAEKIFKEKTASYLTVLRSELKKLDELMASREKTAREEANKLRNTGKLLIVVITLTALAVGAVFSIYLTRALTRPIVALSEYLLLVANGDLTVNELHVAAKDELGIMAGSFNRMVEKLRNVCVNIRSISQSLAEKSGLLSGNAQEVAHAAQQASQSIAQVAQGSVEQSKSVSGAVLVVDQVTLAIEQIASGAQEQSRNVVTTTSMVLDMTKKIDMMAEGMEIVKQVAEQNGTVAVGGGQAVERTVNGMQKLKEAVFETAQKIHELGEQSQKIGEIIQVIDDIAEQTNLLALNAAIEAARAGEHGKGFAVVADEVRKLAERSGKATKEIADLINTIQQGTRVAVNSMEVSTREVEEGVSLAQEAGHSLNEIVEGVRTVGEHVHKIIGLINEILGSSQEVSRAIDNVAAVTQENTAATQEMSASAEQVNVLMQNISSISEESASSAEEVTSSTEEVASSIKEIASSARVMAEMADEMNEVAGHFMLKKITQNCWDVMHCAPEFKKKCPAFEAAEKRCWLIEGTWCGGVQQGDAKTKRHRCMTCQAFKLMT